MTERSEGWVDWLSRRLLLTEIFSLLTSYGFFHAQLDHRKPPREAIVEAMARPLPSYARWPRVLGLVAVILIAIDFLWWAAHLLLLPTPEGRTPVPPPFSVKSISAGSSTRRTIGAQDARSPSGLFRVFRFFLQRATGYHAKPSWSAPRLWWPSTPSSPAAFCRDGKAYWSGVRALEIVHAIPIYGSFVRFLSGSEGARSQSSRCCGSTSSTSSSCLS